ncbi:MAG: sugar ABC transporter substrate-binding protein [Gemmatimonadota bacterium]|nr:sugar ABC transporter substrate-binding protein [Gemmatimonadota bacterium]
MLTPTRLVTGAAVMALVACTIKPIDAGNEEIRFWAFGAEGEVVQQLMPDFERENPGAHVRVQQIPWTAAHEKLLTAFVGNATPDVAQLGNTWIAEFVALDALRPLDPFIAASKTLKKDAYFKGIWETNVMDGVTYGIPWYVDTRVMFYRKDLLARAGYDSVPTTWTGWHAAMEAVKKQQGAGSYAIFLPTNEWTQPLILGMQAGSPLLKDGGRYGAFSDPPFRRAFDFYVSLFKDGLAPVAGNQDIANVYQEFARGTFAMYPTGPWNIGEFRRRLPADMQDKWAASPFPGPDGDSSRVSTAGGASIVLFKGSRHQTLAWKLAEFLSRPEQQVRFAKLTGDLPARLEAWKDKSMTKDPAQREFYAQLQRVSPLPKVPEMELIASKVIEAAEKSIRGNVPSARALADLDKDVNRILEKRRWMLARDSARGASGVGRRAAVTP